MPQDMERKRPAPGIVPVEVCTLCIRAMHHQITCVPLLPAISQHGFLRSAIKPTLSGLLFGMQGLGKTAQSIATLAFQKQFLGRTGPHIVIAPLTTLGHWQREIKTWTYMV